jgi:hypothetical protein
MARQREAETLDVIEVTGIRARCLLEGQRNRRRRLVRLLSGGWMLNRERSIRPLLGWRIGRP